MEIINSFWMVSKVTSTIGGNDLEYVSTDAGTTTQLNGGGVVPSNPIIVPYEKDEGVYMKVWHRNHGMYNEGNRVVLSGITPSGSKITQTIITVLQPQY